MKNQTNTALAIRSSLALALALAIWSPIHARSAEPAKSKMKMDGKMMTETNMMQRCQAMKAQKDKMAADLKAQDAELTAQVAKMIKAPENKKLDMMATVVSQMVEQRIAMDARKTKMEEEMMQHMMQHMQMGKESMAQCPMMNGMKDMDDKSANAPTKHHAEEK
jgi:hypothetical protein